MLKDYLKAISDTSIRGDAREESYYSVLKSFLEEYCQSKGKSKIHITTLPKKTEAGNPDFRIWDGKQQITGYIEAKDPSVEDLDKIEESEQLKRYLHTFANLILTNFLEFRLYRNGQRIDKVVVGRAVVLNKIKTTPPAEREGELINLLDKFFSFSIPKVYSSQSLAVELAKRTRFLKDEVIAQELREGNGFIRGFYEAFKEYLISGLTEAEFSDLYAQTITYGLFAARVRAENGFNRKLAYDNIPKTIGILRDLFRFVSSVDIPQQMEWIIDDISEVLSVADINKILHEYFHEGKGTDPIIHFYETFLREYDPKTREMRGVYYTPEPVVSYIVRSIHLILKEEFNKPDGFADRDVTVLDPSAGTMTFLAEAAKVAIEEFSAKYGEGSKQSFIKEYILENFYAFELMMAPYAIGHLKMSLLLEEWGYKLSDDERFKLYLTNTLEMEELPETRLPGMASLSKESHLAGKVKREHPILVILGNPPYSYHSTNIGEWISSEIKAYYNVDGKPLDEKNPKGLQDDYVKFIRFAQCKIEQAGEGILGFITNHSYLDNPTFRGMRQSLMQRFDKIFLLDLHGNSLKKEKCPDGSKDENVFDIRQGVCIALFIKNKGQDRAIYHSELWGLRDEKYSWLFKKDIKTTRWKRLSPKSEFYLFIPRDEKQLKRYKTFLKITDIFFLTNVGIVTSRDDFVIDIDKEALKQRIRTFRNPNMPDEIVRQTFNLPDTSKFNLKQSRLEISKELNTDAFIKKMLFRPFDERWIFYHNSVIERTRADVMSHMSYENMSLITVRQVAEKEFNHIFMSDKIVNYRVTLSAKGGCYLFPLYLYEGNKRSKSKRKNPLALATALLISEPEAEYYVKKPNFTNAFEDMISKLYKKPPTPEEIFYYIYAVLYSNIYRTRYAEFLKIDFPRVPFTKDYELFKKMSEYGNRLADLHLLKSQELNTPITQFKVEGSNKVQKVRYDAGWVYINQHQYFEEVPEEVWQYQIGGYQVCDKWLKDRKERILSLDEIQTYCRIITAILKTIEIQRLIDKIYDELEIKS